jgi:hypothetical protein
MNRHLDFRHITVDDITTLRPLLANSGYRSCDYTIGGLLLWADYLNYSYCVCDGTLFVMGLSEADTASRAFSLPIGPMPMAEALALIEDYCHRPRYCYAFFGYSRAMRRAADGPASI